MDKKYHKALIRAGFTEESETYRKIKRELDRENKAYRRDKKRREKAGIIFNSTSAITDDDGNPYDFIASEDDVEERILHEIELQRMRICLAKLPKEDQDFLRRLYQGGYSELSRIAREWGIPRKTLEYRREKLLKKLRKMMD